MSTCSINSFVGKINWDERLYRACKNNDINTVTLVIEKGENSGYIFNWNEGFKIAYSNKNLEVANLMIKNGAEYWNI